MKIALEKDTNEDQTAISIYNDDGKLVSSVWLDKTQDAHGIYHAVYALIRGMNRG